MGKVFQHACKMEISKINRNILNQSIESNCGLLFIVKFSGSIYGVCCSESIYLTLVGFVSLTKGTSTGTFA